MFLSGYECEIVVDYGMLIGKGLRNLGFSGRLSVGR